MAERVARVPREEVRRRVLEAAERLYAQQGIAATSIEDVARAAGFTKGAVFSNFATKDELVAAILDERVGARLADVVRSLDADAPSVDGRAASAPDVPATVGAMLARSVVEDDGGSLLVLEYLIRAARDPASSGDFVARRRAQRERVASLIEHQARLRDLTLTLPPSTLAFALITLASAVAAEHRADPDGVDPDALAEIVEALMR